MKLLPRGYRLVDTKDRVEMVRQYSFWNFDAGMNAYGPTRALLEGEHERHTIENNDKSNLEIKGYI